MKKYEEIPPLTHEELVAEAIALIQRSESWQIQQAIEAAAAHKEKNKKIA